VITFDKTKAITSTGATGKGYDQDTVLKHTITHEMGHALLTASNSDHCNDPNCIMYGAAKDWEMHDFSCSVHGPGGSQDIRTKIHNHAPHIPNVPTLLSPSNGATNVVRSPSATLKWKASSGAQSYELQVSTSNSFPAGSIDVTGITSLSSQVLNLNATTYYWRVRATNGMGTSGWSSIWSFTTKQ
jgi:hypothetical protein